MPTGANRTQLGQYNIKAVIQALRRLGPTSQQALAAESGLSVQAVSVIVRRLLGTGQLREARTESRGRGRPRVILELVPAAAYSVGVHVDPSLITAVLLDLSGEPVRIEHSSRVDTSDPAASMDEAADLVARLQGHLGGARDRIMGSALAVPGRIDLGAGAITDSVWLPQWNHAPISALLSERIGMPSPLLKDTFAAVSGEIWVRGPQLHAASIVYVYFGIGTGIGLAADGRPLGGETGNAGQVGTLFEGLLGDARQSSPTAQDPVSLVRSAHEQGLIDGDAPAHGDLAAVDEQFRDLCRRARSGDEPVLELLRAAAGRIHHAASITADLMDAGSVVLGGPYWPLLSSTLLPEAQRLIENGSRPWRRTRVLASAIGADAAAIGAASWVLERHFSPSGALATA